jgi:hypothetical protein
VFLPAIQTFTHGRDGISLKLRFQFAARIASLSRGYVSAGAVKDVVCC